MKKSVSGLNEKIFFSKEMSSIGTARLLKGKAARLFNYIGRSFAYSSTRAYGCFLLSFGLLSILLNLGEYYFAEIADVRFPLIIGVALAVLSIPLLCFDRPMCVAFQDFALTDYLLFEFFAIKRMHRNVNHKTISPLVAMFLGFIPATLGFFLSVEWVILSLTVLVITAVSFTTPEFPMILMILAIPYLPIFSDGRGALIMISLSLLMFISYFIKVAIGKRVYTLDIYDILIFSIMLLVFIGGGVSAFENSMKNALIFIALILGYVPVSNLIINRRLADCAINAVIVSALPISLLAIAEFIIEAPIEDELIYTSSLTPGVSVFFKSPSMLAAFLLVAFIFSLFFFVQHKRIAKKTFYIISAAANAVSLALVMQPAAWLSLLLVAIGYSILTSRKIPADAMLWLFVLPHLLLLLPAGILDAVFGIFSDTLPNFTDKISAYEAALSTFSENIWLGVGIIKNSYGAAGLNFHAMNNTLGIGVEFGIFVLVIFLAIIILRFRHISFYRQYVRITHSGVSGNASTLALLALLCFGFDAYLFSDFFVGYLFWLVLAISTAALRMAKREYDDRQSYYGQSSSADAAVIDVEIQK